MEVTRYYIGDRYEIESFPPMRQTIKMLGIDGAVWVSRGILYTYFFFALLNHKRTSWLYFLILANALYWTAMIPWVFQLGIVKWPLSG
jgi:hypothetical protein